MKEDNEITMSDLVSPSPSEKASKLLHLAMEEACEEQKNIIKVAGAIGGEE